MAKFKPNRRYTPEEAALIAGVTLDYHKRCMGRCQFDPDAWLPGKFFNTLYGMMHYSDMRDVDVDEDLDELAEASSEPDAGRPRDLKDPRDRKRALAIIVNGHKEGLTLQGEVNEQLLRELEVSWRTCRDVLSDELRRKGVIK